MKIFFTAILALFISAAYGQQYNNEWIDYSKTYYKFKIGQTGLYRISQTTLNAVGLGNTPAEQFKLIRNGVEIPIYTSIATGQLNAGDYIEFWGEKNDGKADRAMYRNPSYQHSDAISLLTDTAVLFLTVNSTGSNLRLTEQPNNVTSGVQAAETYFMYTTGNHFNVKVNPGFAKLAGDYIYSSSYDIGEFWATDFINASSTSSTQLTNLFVYTSGPNATIKFGAAGCAPNARTLSLKINNTSVKDVSFSDFNDVQQSGVTFSPTLISTNTATVTFTNTSAVTTDRMVVSYYDITYPRQFNFGGAKNFAFTLPAKGSDYYLAITNFNKGAAVPVLYDLTNGNRYAAVAGGGDTVKFSLPASSLQYNLVLVNEEVTNVINVTALTPKTFVNFNNSANQGNYIIISNPLLYTGSSGNNPVDDYKDYRASAVGGGYNVTIANIDELVDQFAYGIKKHPLSIKNFIQFARDKFSVAPKYVLLIGRGVDYMNYGKNQKNPLADRTNLIPTFGWPASDNMLSSVGPASAIAATPIGRISVINGIELENYLAKLKEYEESQRNAPNTLAARLWMKNVMEVTGASQLDLGVTLCNFMHGFKDIIEDSLTGAKVSLFCKNSANAVELLSTDKVANLFEEGMSLLTYFGHSSSTALEFNIDDPQNYNNTGKYPVFSVNGCNAGNFFTFDQNRVNVVGTLSEKFTLAKQKGGIAFLASTYYGLVNYLNIYINALYKNMSNAKYGKTLGEIFDASLTQLLSVNSPTDFFARAHAEEITLHGDPALKMNFQEKPDYVIEDAQVKISPSFISIAETEFNMAVKIYNLGKAINDSIVVQVKRQYPDGISETIYSKKIKATLYSDSFSIKVPVIGTRDKGTNKITVTVDATDAVQEMDENNNSVTKEFIIYEDEARPAYPYNFSIVNNPAQKLYASTADPLSSQKQYLMELDTTINFNSIVKVSKSITSIGGVLEFDPGINFTDSTVYYWRVAQVPASGSEYHWNMFSFIYLKNASNGFNQSHYYQQQSLAGDKIFLDNNTRKWKFTTKINIVDVSAGAWGSGAFNSGDVALSVNGLQVATNACAFSTLAFSVFDPVSFKPWVNQTDANNNGKYGSWRNNCFDGLQIIFEFRHTDPASRQNIINFMDNIIPNGYYVVIRSFILDSTIFSPATFPQAFANDWKADASIVGNGNTLYDKLLQSGFAKIDSFYRPRNFIFIYKKNSADFTPRYAFTQGLADLAKLSVNCPTPDTLGYISSPKFGPAKIWKQFKWMGKSEETNSADRAIVDILGIDANNNATVLSTIDRNTSEKDISSISASQYPYLQLRMRNLDSVTLTPYQLDYWRLYYDAIPEGAVAPNLLFSTKDSLDVGEKLNFAVAFKNISQASFDSIKAKLILIDNNNVSHDLPLLAKEKPLGVNDTVTLRYEIDTKSYPGNNTLSVDFNPDNDQPEQYHYNNFLFRNFYVRPDRTNPLMDVTFDGIHILNNDIVSSKPHIQIKVKDEAKFMLLNDTSIVSELKVKYPDAESTVRTYQFNTDTLRFTPAQNGSDNTATIDFFPYFPVLLDQNGQALNPDGDSYTLTVKSKDKSGNSAGQKEYSVSFKVIDKPMISNLLNYPNPFTTSTAFVFTITGSEVPQNIKIQILTVTGKIVREITGNELGPIHIGRNITEFKWNGTDQYGQRLANGVYLYRVITTLNGKRMEKYTSQGDDTDRYFTKGYGKMYLMR